MARVMVELEMDEEAEAALHAENEGTQLPYLFEGVQLSYEGVSVYADLRFSE